MLVNFCKTLIRFDSDRRLQSTQQLTGSSINHRKVTVVKNVVSRCIFVLAQHDRREADASAQPKLRPRVCVADGQRVRRRSAERLGGRSSKIPFEFAYPAAASLGGSMSTSCDKNSRASKYTNSSINLVGS
jgi:hypothetical protein